MAKILCIDDDAGVLGTYRRALLGDGHSVVGVHNVEAALNVLSRGGIDLIIADYCMPGTNGLELLARLKRDGIDTPVIMVTGYGSIDHAVTAMKAGAIDYMTKPIDLTQLCLIVRQTLELMRLRHEREELAREDAEQRSQRRVVGESGALQRVLETIRTIAPTDASVLLEGETGTGKEVLAREIHALSGRQGHFIPVNCAALPEGLVESTLFGHEKGAFTGAHAQVKGAFESADGGTLLLDEISEMRLDLQAKLLRVLQEKEFMRIGGARKIKVDVRVIATTNRNLFEEVEKGNFRADLYYRLSVIPIRVPPLRERPDDIPLLAEFFAKRMASQLGRRVVAIAPEMIERLQSYSWPGNVRELEHTIQRAVILSKDEVLGPEAFEFTRLGLAVPTAGVVGSGPKLAAAGGANDEKHGRQIVLDTVNLAEAEEILIQHALEITGQNRTRAAKLLGITDRTLRNKLNV